MDRWNLNWGSLTTDYSARRKKLHLFKRTSYYLWIPLLRGCAALHGQRGEILSLKCKDANDLSRKDSGFYSDDPNPQNLQELLDETPLDHLSHLNITEYLWIHPKLIKSTEPEPLHIFNVCLIHFCSGSTTFEHTQTDSQFKKKGNCGAEIHVEVYSYKKHIHISKLQPRLYHSACQPACFVVVLRTYMNANEKSYYIGENEWDSILPGVSLWNPRSKIIIGTLS